MPYRRILSSTSFWVFGAAAWSLVSLAWSVHAGGVQWVCFQRAGSVLTLAGIIMSGRAIMREGRTGASPKSPVDVAKVESTFIGEDGRVMVRARSSEETKARRREEGRDAHAAVVGMIVASVGTLIWGYGDLLGGLFGTK